MSQKLISILWGLVSAALFGLYLWLTFQSGCAGDLKGGSGDIEQAMQLELQAMSTLCFAALCFSAWVGYLCRRPHWVNGIYCGLAYLVLSLVGGWFLGFWVEIEGIRHCA